MAYVSLDRDSLAFTKNSINNVDPGNQKFCRDLIEFVDMSCISSDDDFFYDMMKFIRFMKMEGIACTDTNGLIMMNPPQMFKSLQEWDFIYDHECLHQLWDTFGVADKIQAAGQQYDHELLNIASDCVINDYLDFYRGKTIPGGANGGLVTPESVKNDFGVVYDRSVDTQYSLYIKIIKACQEDPNLAKKMKQKFGKLQPKKVTYMPPGKTPPPPPPQKHSPDFIKGWCDAINDVFKGKVDPLTYRPAVSFMSFAAKSSKSADWQAGYDAAMEQIRIGMEQGIQVGGSSGSGGGGDLPQIPWDIPPQDQDQIDNMDSDEASDTADQAAQEADQAAREAEAANDGSESKQSNAKKAKEAAGKAKEAAKKAEEAARRGDEKGAKEATKEAVKEARKAKAAAEANKQSRNKGDNRGGGPSQRGDYEGYADLSPEELSKLEKEMINNGTIRSEAKKTLGKYLSQSGGFIGNFLKKCRVSKDMKESGLATDTGQKKTNWGKKVFGEMSDYIADVVQEHKMQYKRTYSRFKRGSMVPEPGQFLSKGKQSIEDKFPISIAFWVDCSGSMGNGTGSALYNASKCMYALAGAIEDEWSDEALISEFAFEYYAWDTSIYPLRKGEMPSSGGSTMSLDELVKGMMDRKNTSMINIIITDGGGGLGSSFDKYIKGSGSLVIFVTNTPTMDVKRKAESSNELSYVEAPSDFSLS